MNDKFGRKLRHGDTIKAFHPGRRVRVAAIVIDLCRPSRAAFLNYDEIEKIVFAAADAELILRADGSDVPPRPPLEHHLQGGPFAGMVLQDYENADEDLRAFFDLTKENPELVVRHMKEKKLHVYRQVDQLPAQNWYCFSFKESRPCLSAERVNPA